MIVTNPEGLSEEEAREVIYQANGPHFTAQDRCRSAEDMNKRLSAPVEHPVDIRKLVEALDEPR